MTKTKRSVLFSCQVFTPDEGSTSQLFTPVMQEFAHRGYGVTVLCGFPDAEGGSQCVRHETYSGISIRRLGLRLSAKKNFVNRFFSYTSYLVCIFPQILFAPRETCLFAVTNPPFLAWILALASFLRGQSFNFMFLDLHPEGLVALGRLNQQAWMVRAWKYLNGVSYRRAQKLFVLGRDMIPILSESYGIKKTVFRYIPHWSPSESNGSISFSSSRYPEMWGVSNCFVIQYSGNMGLWHDIDTFIRAAKLLEQYKHIQFIFIGGGIRRNKAMNLASELGISNIHWKDFVPLSELSESLAACHLALISLNKDLEGVAVPCKLYGILASGRAVIAQVPKKSEVAITVLEHNCGVVVEPGDFKGLADIIYKLSNNLNAVQLMSSAAFRAYLENYQIKNAVDAFEEGLFH